MEVYYLRIVSGVRLPGRSLGDSWRRFPWICRHHTVVYRSDRQSTDNETSAQCGCWLSAKRHWSLAPQRYLIKQ